MRRLVLFAFPALISNALLCLSKTPSSGGGGGWQVTCYHLAGMLLLLGGRGEKNSYNDKSKIDLNCKMQGILL